MPRASVTRKVHFNAAHRVHNPKFSDQWNRETFGECNNPNYHGHNYELELTVEDDGPGAHDGTAGGHGLVGMRERVALYGGVLETGSANGRGFRVHARLPFREAST